MMRLAFQYYLTPVDNAFVVYKGIAFVLYYVVLST